MDTVELIPSQKDKAKSLIAALKKSRAEATSVQPHENGIELMDQEEQKDQPK